MDFLNRNGAAIQAIAGILTVLLAVAALVGVKMQIDAAEKVQQTQSARDIYREYLSISVANPAFAQPDYCAIAASDKRAAYENFVGYLLYAAEQNLEVSAEWKPVMMSEMKTHAGAICDIEPDERDLHSDAVVDLINAFQSAYCSTVKDC